MQIKTIFLVSIFTVLTACQAGFFNREPSSIDIKPYTSVPATVSQPEPLSSNSSNTDSTSVEETGLNIPVAHVSAKYAADAQRMLDEFYSASKMIPREYLTSPFDPKTYLGDYPNGTKFKLFDQWCYKAWGIDFYFYTWEEAANELRNGKTLYEVLELAEESTREHYRSTQCQVGVLCGLDDVVLGEAAYDDGKMKKNTGTIYGVMFWYRWEDTGPVTSLVLTDELMSALENEGFDLSKTRATSVSISGHSCGLYFDDGIIQRYYPQMLAGIQNIPMSVNVFYSTEELIESL